MLKRLAAKNLKAARRLGTRDAYITMNGDGFDSNLCIAHSMVNNAQPS
jgi:hypothetical protein